MTGPRYMTDAERQIKPTRLTVSYSFWVRFQLRPPTGPTITRWFASYQDRVKYTEALPSGTITIATGDMGTTS
jgi:hypothetical protein